MEPNYEIAAISAAETLVRYGITAAPVSALAILKKIPGVLVMSYQSMSDEVQQDRQCVIDLFGEKNHDAFTSVNLVDGKKQYLVTYNQLLPAVLIQRALARELGHIVLGHDGTRPESVRNEEALCFAKHLLCPRPLIHAIQSSGIRFTVDVLSNLTGCNHHCLSCISKLPATHVPADLNRQVRDLFMPYFRNFYEYQRYASLKDGSAIADLGTYMDGYEE